MGEKKNKIEMSLVSIVIGLCVFMIGYTYINKLENNSYIVYKKETKNIYGNKEYEIEDKWQRITFR